ncbi:MAG: hypothetical protein ACE5IC_01305 [Candidatus Brocadiales bacterium]
MFKRLSVVVAPVVFFAAISLGLSLGLETVRPSNTLAQETKCACEKGCKCDHCMGKSEECPCAKKAQEQPAKCEKCGHERCPTNCNRCPDCVMEKMEERRKRSGY